MINLEIHTQPDDETCGPTCLQAIYNYYGSTISLEETINSVERSLSGGTLASLLGKHSLKRGFNATIFVNDLTIFDPTWFAHSYASSVLLLAKLEEQLQYKNTEAFIFSTRTYQEFLRLGGRIRLATLNVQLLKNLFKQKIPILTGLSATSLYRSARERYSDDGVSYFDDVRGTPCGHFVILCGYDDKKRLVVVADPHRENPMSHNNYYKVSIPRIINAILLGVLTYDATLLTIEPKRN